MSGDFRDINTAPRDGTLIEVVGDENGPYRMKWNPEGFNPLASLKPGIWEAERGNFTWSEDSGFGPLYWRPILEDGK